MISWPPELVLDLARRRAILVLGAGVSRNSVNAAGAHPPLWNEFLNEAIVNAGKSVGWQETVKTLIHQNDYLTACDVIKTAMGPAPFRQFMRAQFLTPGYQAAAIHDVLIKIDTRIVLTPNYDKIYENRINAVQNNTVLVKSYYDSDVAEAIRTPGRVVLKAHGTIDAAGEVIFTRTDYAHARQKYRTFYFTLDALAATHTFVFIGCGLNDPDIRLLLEDHAFRSVHFIPHYMMLPRTAVKSHILASVEQALGVKMLLFDPKNNYAEFLASLVDLANRVEARRQTLTIAEWLN
jgi:hypothetical protein